jgi:hypothetical protein
MKEQYTNKLNIRAFHRYAFVGSMNKCIIYFLFVVLPVPVAARSKAQVYGRSPAAIMGSNLAALVV